MDENEPPLLLRLSAALCFVLGAEALAELVMATFSPSHGEAFSANFLSIAIGWFILDRRSTGWWWAILVILPWGIGLVYLISCLWHDGLLPVHTRLEYFYVLLSISIYLLVLTALVLPKSRAWYRSGKGFGGYRSKWVWPMLVAGFLSGLLTANTAQVKRNEVEGLFAADTEFICVDEATDQPVNQIGGAWTQSAGSPRPVIDPRLKFEYTEMRGQDGRLKAKGLVGRPLDLILESMGRPPVHYQLTAQSPRQVTLKFGPVQP